MDTVTQNNGTAWAAPVRIRRDVREVLRKEAFDRRISIQDVVDEVLRARFIKAHTAKRSA